MDVSDAFSTRELTRCKPADWLPSTTRATGTPGLDLPVLGRSSDVVAYVQILIWGIRTEREIGRCYECGAVDGHQETRIVRQEELKVKGSDSQHGRWAALLSVRDAQGQAAVGRASMNVLYLPLVDLLLGETVDGYSWLLFVLHRS